MVAESDLNGLTVLVTRPQQQVKPLCEMLHKAGANVIVFPVIDIVPIDQQHWLTVDLCNLNFMIFVSRNAVEHFVAARQDFTYGGITVVAMGAGTAAGLQEHGIQADIQPPAPAGSESLLAMPEFNSVKDKKILIVRGEGGRELLADTLAARGAKIDYIEVYRRCLPSIDKEKIAQAKTAECVVITSIMGLDNLCTLIKSDDLKNKWLIVLSERIKQYAIQKDFLQVMVATDTNDIAVMQQINKLEIN